MASASPWPPAHGADDAPSGGRCEDAATVGGDGSWGGGARGRSPVGWQAGGCRWNACGAGRDEDDDSMTTSVTYWILLYSLLAQKARF
jgi:hypothetical protein